MTYRAIVHYHFKKGKEEEGLRFLEKELINRAEVLGCHHIELLQNEKDPSSLVGIGLWHNIADARKFQSLWDKKEKELLRLCISKPERKFLKIKSNFTEKVRKVA